MNIETGADARNERRGERVFERQKILLNGQLTVRLGARHDRDRNPRLLEQPGIVGGAGMRRTAVQRKQGREIERLRRLRAIQPRPRHCRDDRRAIDTLERIGHGDRWNGATVRPQRLQQRLDSTRRNERPRRVMNQNDVGRMLRQRLQPGADAILPLRPAGHDGQMRNP